jgi:hypothetical protein
MTIFNGETQSERHQLFFKQNKTKEEEIFLKDVMFGPICEDDLVSYIAISNYFNFTKSLIESFSYREIYLKAQSH